jgi:hypothetical protein
MVIDVNQLSPEFFWGLILSWTLYVAIVLFAMVRIALWLTRGFRRTVRWWEGPAGRIRR